MAKSRVELFKTIDPKDIKCLTIGRFRNMYIHPLFGDEVLTIDGVMEPSLFCADLRTASWYHRDEKNQSTFLRLVEDDEFEVLFDIVRRFPEEKGYSWRFVVWQGRNDT